MYRFKPIQVFKLLFSIDHREATRSELVSHRWIFAISLLALISWFIFGLIGIEGFFSTSKDLSVILIGVSCLIFSYRPRQTMKSLELAKLLTAVAIVGNAFNHSYNSSLNWMDALPNIITLFAPVSFMRSFFSITTFTLFGTGIIIPVLFMTNTEIPPIYLATTWITSLYISYTSSFYRILKTEQFESNSEFLEKLVNSMSEGLVIHDTNGKILKINNSACRILEISEDQALGRTNSDPLWVTHDEQGQLISPENHPSAKTLNDGARLINFPIEYQNKLTGQKKSILVSSVPLYNSAEKKPAFALVTITDRTQQKKTDDELKTNQALLAHASKLTSLGEMAAGIAHEINNPLAVIIARAAILKRKAKGQESLAADFITQNIETIEATCMRISKIITSMRNFARNDQSQELQPVQLKDVLDETIMLCKEGLKKEDVDLKISEFTDFTVLGNSVQLGQVLMNLIQNAKDAVKKQETRWIEISSRMIHNKIEITVCDSGPKMSDEVAQKIMQPFFTTKEVGKGTGLGLSISQSIISKHGGELKLNRDASCTQFVIILPAAAKTATAPVAA
jgi:PAS domain S-box-containing protein